MNIIFISVLLCTLTLTFSKSGKRHEESRANLEEYIATARQTLNPRYRPIYHVAPPIGWMNDPNGFSYYQGKYHIFYQFYPYDSAWGPMHWGHVVSEDLVHWERLPTALLPEEEQCFSGSAIVEVNRMTPTGDPTMILMYTGHVITETEPFYNQTQYLALSDNGVDFYKYEGNPVILLAPNASTDFRDPKVWRHGDHWFVVLGSKTSDNHGRVLLYKSKDMIEWDFLSVLAESSGDLGYMWECPDFFELDGKYVLLISPQGLEPQGDKYKNLYQTGYIVGSFDYQTFQFTPESAFEELDNGHDFYAAQTTEVNGRRLLFGWMGMWEEVYPESVDGWAGMMTIARELRLDSNNRILMSPVHEMKTLREGPAETHVVVPGYVAEFGPAMEIFLIGDPHEYIDILLEGRTGGSQIHLRWDEINGKFGVERDGELRQVEWASETFDGCTIFLDTSSMEIFCGDGKRVFTSRAYPQGGWKLTNLSRQTLNGVSYDLKRSVEL